MARFAPVRRVLYYTLALNLLVTVAKLAIGFLSGSLSVTADGFDSLLNSAANVVGLAGLAVAARPPDPGHPYGHRRFETLATVAIAFLIFGTTVQLLQSAVERLRNPIAPAVTPLTFAAPLFSIAVQGYVAVYEYRKGREYRSEILIADALHTRADVLVSASVVAGLIAVRLGLERADPILAILIAGFIAWIGLEIIRDSSRVLADAAAIDPREVERIAQSIPGVQTVHRVRSRGQADEIYVDLHVHVAPSMPIRQAHAIAHAVEQRLFAEIEGLHDAVVHIEPAEGPEDRHRDLNDRLRQAAAQLPEARVYGVQAHDLPDGRLYATIHLQVARPLSGDEVHALAGRLQEVLQRAIPELADVDVHVERSGAVEEAATADESTYQRVRAVADEIALEMEHADDCYDLAVSQAGSELRISALWECDPALSTEQTEALAARLAERVRRYLPGLGEVSVSVEQRERREGAERH